MDIKSADKRPEKYVGPDGKPRIRMVPVDKQVIKKEDTDAEYHKTLGPTKNSDEGIAALKKKHGMTHDQAKATIKRLMGEAKVDEVSLSAIKKAVQGSGLSNVKKAMPTDKLKKDLAKMKLKLATEGTLSEATDMNKLKQLAAAGLVQKTDVQKLLRVFAKMESGKTVTPAEREMLLSVLSDLTALITGDMSMLQKAKKAVKEDVELNEGLGHISAIQNMMAKEREAQAAKKKKYAAPTQAEIDADKKKDRAAQRAAGEKRPSVSLKSIRQKQYGKMMGGLKKESVELEEKAPKMQGDFLKKERERNRAHDAAMGRTPTGRKKPVRQMTSTQKSLAAFRKEEKVDEVLDRPGALDSYRKKADDSGNKARNSATRKILTAPKDGKRPDHSDELKTMRKRNKGQDMADRVAARQFRKSIGQPYIKKEEYVNEKLKVSDGMGAWVSDFQKSDAPQFKGKSEKERRDMAIAAFLSAKRGAKGEGYVSMAQQRAVWATRKDGGKGHPDNKGKK